jgi:hypothetical protein
MGIRKGRADSSAANRILRIALQHEAAPEAQCCIPDSEKRLADRISRSTNASSIRLKRHPL